MVAKNCSVSLQCQAKLAEPTLGELANFSKSAALTRRCLLSFAGKASLKGSVRLGVALTRQRFICWGRESRTRAEPYKSRGQKGTTGARSLSSCLGSLSLCASLDGRALRESVIQQNPSSAALPKHTPAPFLLHEIWLSSPKQHLRSSALPTSLSSADPSGCGSPRLAAACGSCVLGGGSVLEGWHQQTGSHSPGHVSPFLHHELPLGKHLVLGHGRLTPA